MRLPVLAVLGMACRSESGVRSDLPDYPPPSPRELETPIRTDRVVQLTIPRADALFVVDNSCSMDQEQGLLASNFPSFLTWFEESGLDYHIGVVSTDMLDPRESGRLRTIGEARWVERDTRNPDVTFQRMVEMGIDGHWEEKGRAAVYTAIELLADTENLGFVRDDAGLHVTIVSDENDESGDSPVSRGEFVDWFTGLRPNRRLLSFSSVVGPLTGCTEIGSPGTEYSAVTAAVGGVEWPICDPDWAPVLDALGFLAVGLSREFYLSALPVPGTIEVVIESGPSTIPIDRDAWTYDAQRNSVTFTELVPAPLDTVVLTYEVLAQDQAPSDAEAPRE